MRNSNRIPSTIPLTRFSRNTEFRNSKNARQAGTRCRLKLHNQNNTNLLLQGKALIRPIAFRPTPGPNSGASTPTNGPLGSYVRPGSSNGNNESLVPIVGLLARASPAQGPFNVPVSHNTLHCCIKCPQNLQVKTLLQMYTAFTCRIYNEICTSLNYLTPEIKVIYY